MEIFLASIESIKMINFLEKCQPLNRLKKKSLSRKLHVRKRCGLRYKLFAKLLAAFNEQKDENVDEFRTENEKRTL